MIGGGLIRKFRNLFHVPGEDIILIGFDDRCKSIRKYQMWSKTANKFDNRLEGKTIEKNVAEPFVIYEDKVISSPSSFAGLIERISGWMPFFERFIPEPVISHTVSVDVKKQEEILTFTINRKYGLIFKTDDKPEGNAYLVDMQTGQGGQLIPKQVRIEQDPVIDKLFSVNPFFWGSVMDSFIATELLRGKVEIWKIILFCTCTLILGLVVGSGL